MIRRLSRSIVYLGLLCATSCWPNALADAAPITFGFNGEVTSVSTITIPFDSGLDVAVGDDIRGTFSFEPQVAVGERELEVFQPAEVVVVIDGETFTLSSTTSTFSELYLRSMNDNIIVDFPPVNVIDTIELAAALGPAGGNGLPNVSTGRNSIDIVLWGTPAILNSPSFPADVGVWNAFDLRRSISIRIRDNADGLLSFSASLGPLAVIPEPSTFAQGLLFALITALCSIRERSSESSPLLHH